MERVSPDSPLFSRGREDPEQRDDEVDAQVGLEVGVRLAAADGATACGAMEWSAPRPMYNRRRRRLAEDVIAGVVADAWPSRQGTDGVRRDLVDGKRDLLGAAGLGQDEAVALVDRDAAAQIGQRERGSPSPP